MKGTLAILGMLVAAYAAPLFGNEVPLILEETIQMPVLPKCWDVCLAHDNQRIVIIADSSSDTIATVMACNPSDICLFDTVGVYRGAPVSIHGFVHYTSSPALVLSTGMTTNDGNGSVVDSSRVFCVSILDGIEIVPEQAFVSPSSGSNWYYYGYRVTAIDPLDMVSYGATDLFAVIKRRFSTYTSGHNYAYGSSGNRLRLIMNILDSDSPFTEYTARDIDVTRWPAFPNYCLWSGNDRFDCNPYVCVNYCYFGIRSILSTDSGFTLNDACSEFETAWANSDNLHVSRFWGHAAIYDMTVGAMATITSWSSRGTQIIKPVPCDSAVTTTLETQYPMIIPAYVLIGESSEQALGLVQSSRAFDIIRIEDGLIWGQTSPLDSGYAEMKIIGRYHNETRRLVVRYGSELRIYRFGEPIYTDADDTRPELPQELALSAYPNPFNPTTMIAFDLPKAARASLSVYDLNGRWCKRCSMSRALQGIARLRSMARACPAVSTSRGLWQVILRGHRNWCC
ncbi:MAG: hypothetical protein IPH10_00120 [bacterium]|nr:hypothetical protein [bacterium]